MFERRGNLPQSRSSRHSEPFAVHGRSQLHGQFGDDLTVVLVVQLHAARHTLASQWPVRSGCRHPYEFRGCAVVDRGADNSEISPKPAAVHFRDGSRTNVNGRPHREGNFCATNSADVPPQIREGNALDFTLGIACALFRKNQPDGVNTHPNSSQSCWSAWHRWLILDYMERKRYRLTEVLHRTNAKAPSATILAASTCLHLRTIE